MSWISSIQAIHPLALYFVQKTTIILLLAFTSPSSLLRHAPFPVLLSVSFALLPHYSLHVKEPENILAVAGEVLMGHMEYLEKLLLSQWSFEDYGPIAEIRRTPKLRDRLEKNPHAKGSPPAGLLPRLRFAFWAGTSQRYIKTPHQTLHTPPYSASHPAYIPSRTVFLVRKALIVLSCILLLDVVALSGLTPKDPAAYSHENSGLFPRLWRGDWSDQWGVTRMRSTFGFWTENGVGIQAYYSTLTALGVALHFSSPADRRPVFGSVAKACTLRGYWG